MAMHARPPPPASALGRYRLLSPSANVRVSPLCLGGMNFGDAWKDFLGECNKETTEKILDTYFDQGGNFIDTANNYQAEESEIWIGDWMKKRGIRDQIVLATKFSTGYRVAHHDNELTINTVGNGAKSLHLSVAASLKKLQTDYIDLLYVHWWDHTCSVEELMQSLNILVQQGKVLYLGISDCPAWFVTKCNQYARDHGLRAFSVYQGKYSAATRDLERDVIPMCHAEGMGIATWGTLGGGNFYPKDHQKDSGRKIPRTEAQIQVSEALLRVAEAKKTTITTIALAYAMCKTPYVYPIIGGRSVDHLKSNIEALNVQLSPEEIQAIEDADASWSIGFPQDFLGGPRGVRQPSDCGPSGWGGITEYVDKIPKLISSRE